MDNANFVGFTVVSATQLDIFMNLSKVPVLTAPFWFADYTSWQKQAIAAADSSGWAKVSTTISQPSITHFTFGGDMADGTSFAVVDASQFFSAAGNNLGVKVDNNTITPSP